MDIQLQTPPGLEEQFTQPPGWRWHSFERVPGRRIVFGSVFPKNSVPDAVVVCLEGVREFAAKYFETARWCLEHNMAFWIMDWAGQGLSTRYLDNPQKRHSSGFDDDLKDLDYFIKEYIHHSSVHTDKGRIPLVIMAQSMGANTGLRYLHDHPETFRCAALNTPMTGLHFFRNWPQSVAEHTAHVISLVTGKAYAADEHDWKNAPNPPERMLSSDPQRSRLFNAWLEANPSLRCGGVTYRWVYEAQKSCRIVQAPGFASSIQTPSVIGLAGHEHLVDNDQIRAVAKAMPHAKLIEFPDNYHETLLETDTVRLAFLDAFYNLVTETAIECPEALKPF